ncbi:MAG: hypothetical protein J2P22_20245 [Nocardioides sp.]|nr:hypothetical protein [Nocardioides sp.]
MATKTPVQAAPRRPVPQPRKPRRYLIAIAAVAVAAALVVGEMALLSRPVP